MQARRSAKQPGTLPPRTCSGPGIQPTHTNATSQQRPKTMLCAVLVPPITVPVYRNTHVPHEFFSPLRQQPLLRSRSPALHTVPRSSVNRNLACEAPQDGGFFHVLQIKKMCAVGGPRCQACCFEEADGSSCGQSRSKDTSAANQPLQSTQASHSGAHKSQPLQCTLLGGPCCCPRWCSRAEERVAACRPKVASRQGPAGACARLVQGLPQSSAGESETTQQAARAHQHKLTRPNASG